MDDTVLASGRANELDPTFSVLDVDTNLGDCDELKIPKFGWHSLRHSNATLLDAVGTPLGTVQSLLGHSSPEITRGTYIHSVPAGAKEAVQKVEDLLTGPKRTQIEEIPNLGTSLIQ